jgi:hypothetical protein
VTQGPGYALRTGPRDLDAVGFERAATAADTAAPPRVIELVAEGLDCWRGPAYAGFEYQPWADAERARLTEMRLSLVERQAEARLALGLDLGRALLELEGDILRHAPHLDSPVGDVLTVTAAAYQRAAPAFTRTRLESAATLAGSLALTGGSGLETAMTQRLTAIALESRGSRDAFC